MRNVVCAILCAVVRTVVRARVRAALHDRSQLAMHTQQINQYRIQDLGQYNCTRRWVIPLCFALVYSYVHALQVSRDLSMYMPVNLQRHIQWKLCGPSG